jgi:hypothetical protein
MAMKSAANARKVVTAQRVTGRAAVNAVRAFFEKRSQIYLEVDQNNTDCFAIGRFDSRPLIMPRRALPHLLPGAVEHAVYILAHCVSVHPDGLGAKTTGFAQS